MNGADDVPTYEEIARLQPPDVIEAIEEALEWRRGLHGTLAGYRLEVRRGVTPCAQCVQARRRT